MERETLAQIIHIHYQPLLFQAYRILRHNQDAEDAVQNACLKAWQHGSTLRKDDCVAAWLRQIVYYECIDLLRFRKRQDVFAYPIDQLPDESSKPADSLVLISLNDILLSTSIRHRELLYNKYVMGYTNSQLSQMTGISEGTVKSRLFRARRLLFKKMNKLWS